MASDEEIAREVRRYERDRGRAAGPDSMAAYRETASEIHDELARRIQAVDDRTVDEAAVSAVLDRLDDLEARLDDVESRL